MFSEGCWAGPQHRAFVEKAGPIKEQAILTLKHLYFETFNFVRCALILCTSSLFHERFLAFIAAVHRYMSRHLWVYNVSLERKVGVRTVTVVILTGTESRHRPRRATKNDCDEGDHRPLVQRHSLCDECIVTSIFVLFLSLREPTKKKKS